MFETFGRQKVLIENKPMSPQAAAAAGPSRCGHGSGLPVGGESRPKPNSKINQKASNPFESSDGAMKPSLSR